jgi:phage host-nuclease inhibitor protein Gam
MSTPRSDAKAEAEGLIGHIRAKQFALRGVTLECETKVHAVRLAYADRVKAYTREIEAAEKALERLTRKHRVELMGNADRADLSNGSLMLKFEARVKRVKGMLESLKARGLAALIRSTREAVDWDQIEQLSDAQLAELGTERVAKEWFSYEVNTKG